MMKIKKRIDRLGYHAPLSYTKFTRFRFISTLFIFIYLLYILQKDYFYAPIVAILYYNLFRVVLIDWPLNIYMARYEREAIRFFELVKLSMSKGNNVEKALELTAKYFNNELSYSYIAALIEVKFGKSIKEAISDMQVPSNIVKNALNNLISKDLDNQNRLEVIDNVIEELKNNADVEMQKRIRKIRFQVLIILILIFIPLVLLIIYAKDIIILFN